MSDSAKKAADTPRDYTKYADKTPSDLQERFAAWILEVTGFEPNDTDDFNEGVRLATALRMAFQASPENQEVLEARREAAEAKKNAPKKVKAKKAKVEDDAEVEDDEEETPEPVKRKPGKRAKAAEPAEVAEDGDAESSDEGDDPAPF